MRVIVPGLLQLDGPHVFRHWGGERLYNLKKTLAIQIKFLAYRILT